MNTKLSLRSLLTLFLAAAASASAGLDLGVPASSTPYEPYMRPVKQVLSDLSGASTDLNRVKSLMKQGRSFRYSFTEPYLATLPEVTARTKSGDCKAKTLRVSQLGCL